MTTIVIPTYNEAENLKSLCQKILQFLPEAKIIIVDDSSTDGTQEIIKNLSKENNNLSYIFRIGPKNFAKSYIEGFQKALAEGADKIIQMDADGSHDPCFLPAIKKGLDAFDVVVGSRYIKGGSTRNWPLKRQLISRLGNIVAKISTKIWLNDLTSGFVGWCRATLQKIPLAQIDINGYSFQIEIKHWAQKNNAKIIETPIIFTDRIKGTSKMNKKIFNEAVELCFKKLFNLPEKKISSFITDEENKNYYRHQENYDWTKTADQFMGLETFFHRLRAKIILNLIKKNAKQDGKFLDAGCGTALITRHLPPNSIGLDINPRNLEKARQYAPNIQFIEEDIEKIPFADQTFDTIITTEILEHQLNPQISLTELKRVLKKDGILIGSVPSSGWLWKLRFLSHTCGAKEPFHKHFNKKEITALLKNNFENVKISQDPFLMNWFFVCQQPKE